MTWKSFAGERAWPTIALFGALTTGYGLTWWAVVDGMLPLWAGAIAQTVFAYLAFTPLHEAVHNNIYPARWFEELIGWVSAALLLSPYPAFRVLHLTHHSHTNDPERDPDHWVAGRGVLGVVVRCITIVPRYLTDFFSGRTSRLKSARDARTVSIAYFVAQAALLLGLVLAGFALEVLFLVVVPAIVASGLLAFAFDWLPHHPHEVQGRYVDTRVVLFPGLGVLTLGQSYHTVHHLYPRIPFYRYAQAFHALRGELEANNSPIVDMLRH